MSASNTRSLTDDLGFSTDSRPENVRRNRIGAFLAAVRSWFRAWRRTRPFWGALWLIVAGAWIIYWMSFDIGIALTGGWSYSAGYVMGGALIMFGLVTW
ncbi:DUF6114 domain-containing protein, partial [Streptomyces sp.]|uniref:DUF6114 domain-containing protein n=1 Tax=Streptomyces sp. TaxID=1931 RepID=UPI002F92B5E1